MDDVTRTRTAKPEFVQDSSVQVLAPISEIRAMELLPAPAYASYWNFILRLTAIRRELLLRLRRVCLGFVATKRLL